MLLFLVLANLVSLQQRKISHDYWLIPSEEIVTVSSRLFKSHRYLLPLVAPLSSPSSSNLEILANTSSSSLQTKSSRIDAQLPLSQHVSQRFDNHSNDNTHTTSFGSWIGNQWIPSIGGGYRLYSVMEMQQFFTPTTGTIRASSSRMLFLGDSSARRVYATFFAILNATTSTTTNNTNLCNLETWDLDASHVIDVNKNVRTEVCTTKNVTICRRISRRRRISDHHHRNLGPAAANHNAVHHHSFDYLQASCPEAILKMDLPRLLPEYDVIVIHLGAWHLMLKCRSKRMDDFRELFGTLSSLTQQQFHQPSSLAKIVWVTMGSVGHERNDINGKRSWKRAHDINSKIRQLVQEAQHDDAPPQPQLRYPSLTILDWGSVMEPRSWPYRDRIYGDIAPHYGLEARLVLIQMLMNHLLIQSGWTSSPDQWIVP
jgi:hypothetical protein